MVGKAKGFKPQGEQHEIAPGIIYDYTVRPVEGGGMGGLAYDLTACRLFGENLVCISQRKLSKDEPQFDFWSIAASLSFYPRENPQP
jgi:hypothetical protein